MSYYKQLIILLLFVQVLTSCWARYRIARNAWPIPPNDWKDMEEYGDNENRISSTNAIRESDLFEKFLPAAYKARNARRRNSYLGEQERRKKFLTDSTNIQGLWAMPGRR